MTLMDQGTSLCSSFATTHPQLLNHISGRCIICHRFAKRRRSTEADAALPLLSEHVENKSVPLKTAAIVGLGVAYAGSHPEDLLALLLPAVADKGVSMEIASLSAAFVLGFVFVRSGNGEITSTILQMLIERVKSWIRSVGGSWRWGWRFFMSVRFTGYFMCSIFKSSFLTLSGTLSCNGLCAC
jgi:hypothetical protein